MLHIRNLQSKDMSVLQLTIVNNAGIGKECYSITLTAENFLIT